MTQVSNDKLYDAINNLRNEQNTNIARVEGKVDSILTGPIETIRGQISDLKVKDATLAVKVYMLVGIISAAVSITVTAVVSAVVFKITGVK